MASTPETGESGSLLERDDAFDALESALTNVAAGSGRPLAIGCEAGGGKTALLARAAVKLGGGFMPRYIVERTSGLYKSSNGRATFSFVRDENVCPRTTA